MSNSWTHLVRFIAEEDGQIHLGQVNALTYPDVGLSHRNGEKVEVNLITGSIYDGVVTNKKLHIQTLLSPLSVDQTPIIRCLGLNYKDHAREANMPTPDYPVLFIKPRTALNGPFPAKINIPKVAQDDTADYEAELSFIIGKDGKDIAESKALEYVLGYTASNDVSARTEQLRNSQWCFGKGTCVQSTITRNAVERADVKDLDRDGRFVSYRPYPCIWQSSHGSRSPSDQSRPQFQRGARL